MLSEFNEEYDEENENDEEDFESDPATVAFLDQAGAEFEAQREQFAAMYGFDHDCHCAQDYAEGKLAQVTECYLTLTDDALENSARLNWENQTLQGMVQSLVQMNDDLMKALEAEGGEIDPEKILTEALLSTLEDGPGPEEDASVEASEGDGGEADVQ